MSVEEKVVAVAAFLGILLLAAILHQVAAIKEVLERLAREQSDQLRRRSQ